MQDPSATALKPPAPRRGWLDVGEAGSLFGLRFVVFLCTAFGRPIARAFVAMLALYFVVLRPDVRRASREYHQRLGLPDSLWDSYRHVRCFADTALDRFFLMRGQFDCFQITQTGHEHMVRLSEEARGGILLGAHFGSFEAMRMRSDAHQIPVNVVGYFRNTARINGLLARYNPRVGMRFIEVQPESPKFIFKVRERIEAGELVAILGDRVGHGAKTTVDFLGGRIELPTGPYVLAALLKCPIYLTFGVYRPPNSYDLYCELFAERVTLSRKNRQHDLAAYAQQYADCLERYCRVAPDNWFNFYDYWLERPGPAPTDDSQARPT